MDVMTEVIPAPGTVLCVRTKGLAGDMIRFGAALIGESDLENHVAVLDHVTGSTWWAIEGRPGGVGWVDASAYLESPWTLSNQGQKLSMSQRADICNTMRGLLDVPYDWTAIAQDGVRDLHLPELWAEKWHGVAPAHVVCSSVAAWSYMKNGANYPKNIDLAHVQPADWADFIVLNGYQNYIPAVIDDAYLPKQESSISERRELGIPNNARIPKTPPADPEAADTVR